jgi:dTDP-4-amino-4,6-dideoxygalactose transaminase
MKQGLAMSSTPNNFISFSPPCLSEDEIAEVVDTLRSPWITTGPKVKRFEEEFKNYVGAPAALALNSCTAALHIALKALNIGPGDEVITTALTFTATVNVIEHCGATPVLVDVEPDTLNMCPKAVAKAITPRTKAIIPVHYAGHPVEMDALEAVAEKHGLAIVEDAAHAIPAGYANGKLVGNSNHLTAFSFYATKNLTTAEGGMLTGPQHLIDRSRVLSLHGMNRDAWARYSATGNWFYEVVEPGFKYNLTDMAAALGLHQLRRLSQFQQRRREVWDQYNAAFSSLGCIETPAERPGFVHALHLYVMRLRLDRLSLSRNEVIERMKDLGIGVSVHFIPIHLHPYYRDKYGYKPADFPVAVSNYERMLSLPLHAGLLDSEVDRIIQAVKTVTSATRSKAA